MLRPEELAGPSGGRAERSDPKNEVGKATMLWKSHYAQVTFATPEELHVRAVVRFSIVSLSLLVARPSYAASADAQCAGVCGDLNGNGTVTSNDFQALVDFLYHDSSLSSDPECADIDNYDLINLGDVKYLAHYLGLGGPAPTCPSGQGPITPVPSADFRIEHAALIPADASSAQILFRLVANQVTTALNVAVQMSIEGETPTLDSVNLEPDWLFRWVNIEPPGSPPGSVVAGFLEPFGGSHLGKSDLFVAYISFDPAPSPRLLSVSHDTLPPYVEDDLGAQRPVHYTMIFAAEFVSTVPESTICPIWNTGDVNLDLEINSSDIITTVNYVFKGGVNPYPCPAAADVNCSGAVTSADLIYLVNFVFKSGSSPCDVCAIIPETWNCPN